MLGTNRDDFQFKIRPLLITDYESVLNWSKDESFCLANGWEINKSPEELYTWWLQCVNKSAVDFIRMGIAYNEKLIGYVDLSYTKEATAELGIAIGESRLWGKGIGVNSALWMMDYASTTLGITTINAETYKGNIRSRKMLEKIGFKEISRVGCGEYLRRGDQLIQYQKKLK